MSTDYQRLGSNVSKANPPNTWTTLVTCNLTVAGSASKILAIFTASGTRNDVSGGYNAYFRILYDGAVVEDGGAIGSENFVVEAAWAAGATAYFNATAGAHTIELQWNIDGGAAKINAGTSIYGTPSPEHAALYVEELPGAGPGTLFDETVPVLVDLASDKSANADNTTFTSLVSGNLTTIAASSRLLIVVSMIFAGGADNTTKLRLKVDGSLQIASFLSHRNGYAGGMMIVYAPVVAAGAHTVDVEWVSNAGGTVCNANTDPNTYAAKIYMQEKPL